ncbi:MAG TPA: Trk system potassium transporter TrkA [Bacillota bacterium]|jgi:trk system potassium uptake protein TrkA|nr:Trk system potassium transporter TrkA [Fastidiosipila sp.]HPX93618.1 Trk system potassium transporter TrkA [Bacillota bacterium]HQB81522.1 Trk system potassium transporter TrkA [Bacillota bacterium]
MQIVIAGAGKYGHTLAGELVAEGHDVTIIEKNEEWFEDIMEEFDLSGVIGNAASYATQLEAGVGECDAFMAMTGSDEINLISAILAQSLGAGKTIARVSNPDYSPPTPAFRQSLGIDLLINPNLESAKEIMRMLRYPSAISVESFFRGKVYIVAVRVPGDSILAGMKLLDFKRQCGEDLMVCVIRRDGEVFVPDGKSVIHAGDTIHVTGEVDTLQNFYAHTNTMAPRIRNVLITGGGAIAYWLLGLMNKQKYAVKLIERDRGIAEFVFQHYPWVDVIRADGTDQRVLEECNIQHYDAFISLTGIDEENVLASWVASHNGVQKTITKINRTRLLNILGESDLQNVLTPHHIVSDEIVRTIRALDNSQGSSVEALYRFEEGRVEALEFVANPRSKVIGKTLLELDIRPQLRLACIARGQEILFPGGGDQILAGDRVIVVATGTRLTDLDDILGG